MGVWEARLLNVVDTLRTPSVKLVLLFVAATVTLAAGVPPAAAATRATPTPVTSSRANAVLVANIEAETGIVPQEICTWVDGHEECGAIFSFTHSGSFSVTYAGRHLTGTDTLTWWQNGVVGCMGGSLAGFTTAIVLSFFVPGGAVVTLGSIAIGCTVGAVWSIFVP